MKTDSPLRAQRTRRPKKVELRYDEFNQTAGWKLTVARELNVLIGLIALNNFVSPRTFAEENKAIRSIVARVAEFEEIAIVSVRSVPSVVKGSES